MSYEEKIREIEAEMARTQKNKATNSHLGILKAKIAKLKREQLSDGSKSSKGAGEGFAVKASGDARVGLVGFPSVGKSTLLCKLTGTFSEVASYEFTTLTCIPGVIEYQGSKIQLLDLPGIIEGAKDGKGRGKQVIAVAKTCTVILLTLDCLKPLGHKHLIERELEGFGIRLNKEPPRISFNSKAKGGINMTSTCDLTRINEDVVRSVLKEYKIGSADITFHQDADVDELIDVIEGNRAYIKSLLVLNKIDQVSIEELNLMDRVPHCVPISAQLEWNLDELLERMWEYLDMVRVYTKPKGQIPDYDAPIVLRGHASTVKDLTLKIHKTLHKNFRYALVWGTSVKFSPQRVGLTHVLHDEDICQIVQKI